MRPALTLIVARGRNGVIGHAGGLPWRLATDLALFKQRTLGKPVLMGRRTFDAIGRPLPGRANLVWTRNADWRWPGVWVFSDLAVLLAAGEATAKGAGAGADEVCVIGGADLFAACLPKADRLILTEVDAAPVGDVVFPAFDETDFIERSARSFPAGPRDDHAFVWRELRRRG
jgi:dihydrofolate reductase